jgi:tetratricopeptide (TPR) repeat protein
MSKINKIVDALKKNKYDIAERILLELWRKDSHDAYINYLLGYLYNEYKNPAHSTEKAKRYFRLSIACDKPIENAFWYLAWLEKNQEHAKRILLRGLTFFPKSRGLYERLLTISSNTEKVKLFDEIIKKGIDSDSARIIMIQYYFKSSDFVLALDLIDKVQSQDKTDGMVLQLYKALCFLENKEINKALAEFQQLISQDVTNILEFAPTVLSIVAISRQGSASAENALKQFAMVPEDFQFVEPYFPGNLQLSIDYMAYILEATKFLLRLTRKKDVIARVRAIRALCIVGSEAYGYYSKTGVYKDLIFAHSVLPSVSKYTETLLELAQEKEDTFSAYNFSVELLSSFFGKELDEKADAISWAFISDSTKEIFQQIIEDFERRLKERELSAQVAIHFLSPIIVRLHKEGNYSAVQRLVNLLGDHNRRLPIG